MRIKDLMESPIPDDWDKEKFEPKSTFKSMTQYVLDNAARLGKGSSRLVVEVQYEGRPTAFKVATNGKGIAQNVEEIHILNDLHYSRLDIVVPMIDYDENPKAKWIHLEKADKIKESDFVKLYGTTLREIVYYAAISREFNNGKKSIKPKHPVGLNDAGIAICDDLVELLEADLVIGDLNRVANWGLYQGRAVIVDFGGTSLVIDSFYRK